MATVDAAVKSRDHIIPSDIIDKEVLRGIENDLEPYERLCCMFFLIKDYKTGYKKLLEVRNDDPSPMTTFIDQNKVRDWEEKVIEVLCILQNHQILYKLGINPDDACTWFSTAVRELTFSVDKHAKAFYSLFDSMSKQDAWELINRVNRETRRSADQTWPEKVSLELHLLWWIEIGFINVNGDKWTLKRLLKILKELNMSGYGAYRTLEKYDVDDNDNNLCDLDHEAHVMGDLRRNHIANDKLNDNSTGQYEINSGLVVIFNQMKFPASSQYEYRSGSEVDCRRIDQTFKTKFGFEIERHDNLNKQQIYDELDRLDRRGKEYNCIVVFFLSHGKCGKIIASDGGECLIEQIQNKICSQSLRGKPKVLVIQACQKQDEGLAIDGLKNEQGDIGRFRDTLVLNSTIPGEYSIRDRANGTWFIRILCECLEDMRGTSIHDCLTEVNQRFTTMTGEIDGRQMGQVPSSLHTLSKRLVFPWKAESPSC